MAAHILRTLAAAAAVAVANAQGEEEYLTELPNDAPFCDVETCSAKFVGSEAIVPTPTGTPVDPANPEDLGKLFEYTDTTTCSACIPVAAQGDPYITLGGQSLFLDAPPRGEVDMYRRPGSPNVTLVMDAEGVYFGSANVAFGDHVVAVQPVITTKEAAPKLQVTLDSAPLSDANLRNTVAVCHVSFALSDNDNVLTIQNLHAPFERFTITAVGDKAKISSADDSMYSAHVDFAILNNHLPDGSSGVIQDLLKSGSNATTTSRRRRHLSYWGAIDDQFGGLTSGPPTNDLCSCTGTRGEEVGDLPSLPPLTQGGSKGRH